MSFKENLLKKIEIKRLAKMILSTVGPVGSQVKIDKIAMERLLQYAQYQRREKRELVLYYKTREEGQDRILVLDNDLNVYHTDMDDVLLRKNPTLKEMISIRNAIKILNDNDVVVSKKEGTVKDLEQEALALIDLSYTKADIADIADQGCHSLAEEDQAGVVQAIELFAELMNYRDAPGWLRLGGYTAYGKKGIDPGRVAFFGPVLIYDKDTNRLLLVNDRIGSMDKEKIDWVRSVALGQEQADREECAVFTFLKNAVPKGSTASDI